ncbi:MAG: aminotransferase class V-fold PLP-dependent enzyme [Gemmatimonadota bacterium]
MTPLSAADLSRLRRDEFPASADFIYLNHASTGPLPERTRRALDEFNRKRTAPHTLTDPWIFSMLDECRELAARLINADPREIALTTNTTFGLGLAARMIRFRSGDIVLTPDREFPANVYPWMRLKELGVVLEQVPVTREGWPDEDRIVERLADPRVKVLTVSLVQFSNGFQVDLARLSAATRKSGALLVLDAIQGIGQVPVDLRKTPVDILACGAQKWLLSPWGSGFMYVRNELITRLDPPITGWMAYEGTDDFTQLTSYREVLRDNARRFEMITLPYQDFAGMRESLTLLLSIGVESISSHILSLHAPVLEWARRHGVPVRSPAGLHGSGILCIAPPGVEKVQESLRAGHIIASLREGSIRISPHCYNTPEEMARVVETLETAVR